MKKQKSKVKNILEIVTAATDFDDIPLRIKEEETLRIKMTDLSKYVIQMKEEENSRYGTIQERVSFKFKKIFKIFKS